MSHYKQNNEQQQSIEQQQNHQANLKGKLKAEVPEPEVVVQASRRRFSQSYKLSILEEAEQCTDSGQIGSLLRREGLYSSHLTRWRQARERGHLTSRSDEQKRGRKADPQATELARLKKENERLKQKLEQAQLVVDIQKKASQLLGLTMTMKDESK